MVRYLIGSLLFSMAIAGAPSVHAAYLGNPLTARTFGDADPPLVILGEFNPTAPGPTSSSTFLQDGMITDVQLYSAAAGRSFTVYTIQPAGIDADGNQQFDFLTTSSFTTTGAGLEQFPMSAPVQNGDLLAFAGRGPTYDLGGSDAAYQDPGSTTFTATASTAGNIYSLGINSNTTSSYVYLPFFNGSQQDNRTYSIGVDYVVTPEPATTGLSGIAIVGLLIRPRRKRPSLRI